MSKWPRTGCDRHEGVIVLDDGSTAYDDLKDWLLDYYDIDVEEAEHLTASVLTTEAREYALGLSVELDSEWSAERSAREIYEYLDALGDDRGDETLAGAWWRCGDEGEGWITDEADVEIAAEYLYAAAYEN